MKEAAARPACGPNARYRALGLFALMVLLATHGSASAAATAKNPKPRTLDAAAGTLRVDTVASGLQFPWSLIFLPDGEMLVSEKHPGRLRRVSQSGKVSPPLDGLPKIFAKGNGGLLGLALDPEYDDNNRLYFAYSEPGDGGKAGLAVGRGVLHEDRVANVEVVFRQTPKVDDDRNFGGRLTFAPDGMLFVMTGDRFALDLVQDRSNTIGALVRIEPDGDTPPDNPFVGQEGFDSRIWSYGHRNIEGGAINPRTGQLWIHEFGPWGGDELNIPEPGRNYGWPLVSWGRHYSGRDIPDPPTRPDLAGSIFMWNPVISPSGMSFYQGASIPAWRGNLLLGGLSSTDLIRLTLDGDRVIAEERINFGGRIRDVAQGRDGALYVLTDQPKGEIFRLVLEDPAGGSRAAAQ